MRMERLDMLGKKNRVTTIKDISESLNISTTTVHRALQGKEGVSDILREKILNVAEEMGYVPNYIAASMKRKTQKVAVILPADKKGRKLYFDYIWEGIKKYSKELKILNIVLEEYIVKDEEEQYNQLKKIADLELGVFSGVLTFSFTRKEQVLMQLQRLIDQDVKVVVIDDDLKEPEGVFCIPTDEQTIGKLAGEFISLVTSESGTVLVSGGRDNSKVHKSKIDSFIEYLKEHKPKLDIQILNGYSSSVGEENPLYKEMLRVLSRLTDLRAIYALTSYDNLPIVEGFADSGYLEKVCIVGSDMNVETEKLLAEGKLSAVIDQSAYEKGYMGLKILADAVLRRMKPRVKNFCSTNVVLKSNMSFYI